MTIETTAHTEHGDRKMALENEILRTTVGSGVHGIAIEGTDDNDEMGVYIESREYVLGGRAWDYREQRRRFGVEGMPHFTYRTQPEGDRSGPGDTDLSMYSLRKYLLLALKGNPTALLPLFAPESMIITDTPLGKELRGLRNLFLSRAAVERFLGYMEAQHRRMLGLESKDRPNRPELVEQYGWDVKYGSHALRLAYQGHEIASTGKLTLPLASAIREQVVAVKTGQFTRDEVSRTITELETAVRKMLDDNNLAVPPEPAHEKIATWSINAHRRQWGWL